jgi:hypothetical protein
MQFTAAIAVGSGFLGRTQLARICSGMRERSSRSLGSSASVTVGPALASLAAGEADSPPPPSWVIAVISPVIA